VKLKYTETVLPALGYVTDEKSIQAMSGVRVATHQRELERSSPWLLVKAMDEPGKVRARRIPAAWPTVAAGGRLR
jgi:hypothetical protein